MTRTPPIKLSLAVAAIAMLIAIAAFPGVTPRGAEATVSPIGVSDTIGEDGQVITITINGTDDDGTLTVTNGAAAETFTVVSCNADGVACAPAGNGTGSVTLDTDALADPYELVLTMTLDCTDAEVITVSADDDDNTATRDIICVEDDDDPEVIVEKESNDSADYDFDWDADGTCVVVTNDEIDSGSAGTFDLEDEEQALFFCDDDVDELIVDEDQDGNFSGILDCDEGDEGIDDIDGSTIDFDLSELEVSDTVSCTWLNEGAIATATAIAGPVTSVQVTASNITSCGGTTAVQVFLRNASGGPAPAGTSVT
ncbi:MAG TPA: hypothetical protein VG845_13365, partial [Dehalococcoidia bacterium]|nr:hypothetical protein [Dehalococcoidia bacterium]